MDETPAVNSHPHGDADDGANAADPGAERVSTPAPTPEPERRPSRERTRVPQVASWAPEALAITALVGVVAKILGILVAPGMRGVASQGAVEAADVTAASASYAFAALLVALLCAGSFELARAPHVGVVPRGLVVAMSGLVIALASPALVERLPLPPVLACAGFSAIVALIGGVVSLRTARTRAVGGVLLFFTMAALTRPSAWVLIRSASEHASMRQYEIGRLIGIAGVVIRTVGVVLAATWLATRSRWRDRLLVNAAFLLAFATTYVVVHDENAPSVAAIATLRGSLLRSPELALAFDGAPVAVFLVLVTVLLAIVAVFQKTTVSRALSFVLLSGAAFDVPLHALAITAAAQWLLLGEDPRTTWKALLAEKSSAS